MTSSPNILRELDTQQTFDEFSQRIEASDCHNLTAKFGSSQAWGGLITYRLTTSISSCSNASSTSTTFRACG